MGASVTVGDHQRASVAQAHGADVVLHAADGHRFDAYRAMPAEPNGAGLVVLHEIFGVNAHIREVCDGYAALGFTAIAQALFDRAQRGVALGYDADSIETG